MIQRDIDVYLTAAIVGLNFGLRREADNSPDKAKIHVDTVHCTHLLQTDSLHRILHMNEYCDLWKQLLREFYIASKYEKDLTKEQLNQHHHLQQHQNTYLLILMSLNLMEDYFLQIVQIDLTSCFLKKQKRLP